MVAKKTKVKKVVATHKAKNSDESMVLKVLKDVANGILKFFKFIFDFIIQILTVTLKYSAYIIGSVALLLVGISLFFYLFSAAVGLKDNEEWQKYISEKVTQLMAVEEDAMMVEVYDEKSEE